MRLKSGEKKTKHGHPDLLTGLLHRHGFIISELIFKSSVKEIYSQSKESKIKAKENQSEHQQKALTRIPFLIQEVV